jgi:glycosyltransferase involved in cell wall biosynthesis
VAAACAGNLVGTKSTSALPLKRLKVNIVEDKAADEPFLRGARVIIVIGRLELGGAERQAILLAQHIALEHKAEVEVWGFGEPGRAAELCEEHGITWRSAPIPLPWSRGRLEQFKRLIAFARALRATRPDVILPFMFLQSVTCGLVWRLTGARACVWNQRCEGLDRLGRRAEKLAVRFTPEFIANSEHGANFLIDKIGVPKDSVTVIHNGVQLAPPQYDRVGWRAQLRISDDSFVACMVANLQTFKDHATLLRAWRIVVDRLKREGREAVLLLAGRFDETHIDLKALAYDLDLQDTVRFLGPVQDVSGLLGAVDLGVHSSVYEGCPNGVLECMSAGLAVAGTDCAGIREAVGPAGFAYLAPPRDADALAEKIVSLAFDNEQRRRAGEANLQRIATEFTPKKMYDSTLAVIAKAVRRNGKRNGSQAAQVI